jgi:AraC family transcriptional regulator
MLTPEPLFLDGIAAYRIVSTEPISVSAHRHETVALTVPLFGGLTSIFDGGEAWISGPSAVIHAAGSMHAGAIGGAGLDAVELEFEPTWLRRIGIDPGFGQTRYWTGGKAAAAALRLAKALNKPLPAMERTLAVEAFFQIALTERRPARPAWLDYVTTTLRNEPRTSVNAIAARLDLNPCWLGRAYRAFVGEGMLETSSRHRIERAAELLMRSNQPLAEIAVHAGFYDQSHMSRCFRAALGRTPLQMRKAAPTAQSDRHIGRAPLIRCESVAPDVPEGK